MTERLAVLSIATKHISLWTRQLEMKRKEAIQLAGLMNLEEVKRRLKRRRPSRDGQKVAHATSLRW